MWFYVMDTGESGNETRKFLCELKYDDVMPQLFVKNTIHRIEVEVEAPAAVIDRLRYDSIVCEVDLGGRSPGRYREPVRVRLPQNVRLYSLNPSEVDIELLRQATRAFPVEVSLPQDIPAGQYLESVEVVPKEVYIRGTEKDLAKIGSVSINPTFSELSGGRELLLPISVSRSESFEDEVTPEPQQVKMNAMLVRGLPKKKVPVTVRVSGKPTEDYALRSVTTDPAEVMLEGTKALLDDISAIETETVDISGLSADQTMVVPLRPLRQKNVTVVGVSSVRLQVRLEPIAAQKQFSGVPVEIEGANGGRWVVSPAAVDVAVETSPSEMRTLDDLGAIGFRAWVDVSGIFLRSATLPVRVSFVSGDLKSVRTIPSTVNVVTVGE
jgi:YbbR domain-containing protein